MNIPHSISQPCKTSSLLHQLKTRHNSYEYSSFNRLTTENKFAFTQSRNALIVTKQGRPIYLALIISQGAASITNIVRTWKSTLPSQTTRENNLSSLNEMHIH